MNLVSKLGTWLGQGSRCNCEPHAPHRCCAMTSSQHQSMSGDVMCQHNDSPCWVYAGAPSIASSHSMPNHMSRAAFHRVIAQPSCQQLSPFSPLWMCLFSQITPVGADTLHSHAGEPLLCLWVEQWNQGRARQAGYMTSSPGGGVVCPLCFCGSLCSSALR